MPALSYEHVDVFTETPLQGNPLAVFAEPGDLSDRTMQRIARELNLSETVFVYPPATARSIATLRIFTPVTELAFAGHPTVGTVSVLAQRMTLPDGEFCVDEGVGPVTIRTEPRANGWPMVWLTTPAVELGKTESREAAAAGLALSVQDLDPRLPPQYASAGNVFLFVALKDRTAVDRAILNQQALPSDPWPGRPVVGVFFFALESKERVYSRMFGPAAGVAEDPATGSATGPLAAYLLHYGMLSDADDVRFVSRQGVKMGRESLLHVRARRTGGAMRIEVGGTAVPVVRAEIRF